MKVFIAVPLEGRKYEDARHEADLVKAALSRKGHIPVSPFDIYAGKDADYNDTLTIHLRAALECDCIFLCVGWGNSPICCTIFDAAKNLNRAGDGKKYKIMYGKSKEMW